MNTTHSAKKKLLAQALGITAAAVLGVLASAGTAAADGHNINDPNGTWPCAVGPCSSSGSAWGAQDVGEQRGEDWVPAVNEGDMVAAVHSIDASTEPPHNNTWPQNNLPVASYPAPPSWPGSGWGVADN
jgi:hypothetical protein